MTDPSSQTALSPQAAVWIRFPTIDDFGEFVALRTHSRDWLEPWEPLPADGLVDTRDFAAFHRFTLDSDTESRKRFLVCRASDGAILGQAALNQIIRGPLQQAFLGYWIARPYAGQGYMTAALRLVLNYAFGPLHLHRVEANIQPHNQPSIALANRIGFRREGFSPRYLRIQGQWADHERWAVTAEDWAAGQSPVHPA